MPIQQLSGMLSDHTGFRITDRTGLSGLYDWDLTWTPENFRGSRLRQRPFGWHGLMRGMNIRTFRLYARYASPKTRLEHGFFENPAVLHWRRVSEQSTRAIGP